MSSSMATAFSALSERDQVRVTRVGRRRDADERNAGCAGAARVVDGVADVPACCAALIAWQIFSRPSGRGLRPRDIVHADDRVESADAARNALSVSSASQRSRPVKTANRKRSREPLEQAVARNPALAQNQPVRSVAVKDGLEVFHHGSGTPPRTPASPISAVRELPVVVPAAPILPVLNLLAADAAR